MPHIDETIERWGKICGKSIAEGGAIFLAGNGGSFADAQHISAELTGKLGRTRGPLPGITLGANSSSMSAIGNDYGYEFTFSRELAGLARPNSMLLVFTTSGNSRNILEAVKVAQSLDYPVLGLTGHDGGLLKELCETIRVPSSRTERIQELHILLGHIICLIAEESIGACADPLKD